jgi:hypothetical protein
MPADPALQLTDEEYARRISALVELYRQRRDSTDEWDRRRADAMVAVVALARTPCGSGMRLRARLAKVALRVPELPVPKLTDADQARCIDELLRRYERERESMSEVDIGRAEVILYLFERARTRWGGSVSA